MFYDNAELFDDGSVVYINNLATVGQNNFYLYYTLMHVTDTSSECLGMNDNFSILLRSLINQTVCMDCSWSSPLIPAIIKHGAN
jgi:hypothetical protein